MAGLTAGTFRAFKSKNYTLFFCGQSLSQIGTWMQRTAVSWLVYNLSHSAFVLGLTVFAQRFPSFLLSLWGGIVADRYNRHNLLLITQAAAMLQAVVLAVLALTHHYEVWEILLLSSLLGIITAFDVPARQPLVHELISDKADLPNALALNSSMNNFARLIGPALSGIVLQLFGAGVCFLLNALSFVAVIISLMLLKLPAWQPAAVKKKSVEELMEGFVYLKRTPSISTLLVLLTLVSLLVLPYDTLLPVMAKTVYGGNAATFGYINSFIGLGAVAGAGFLASRKPGANLKKVLWINSIILGTGLILFSRITNFNIGMAVAVACGFGTMSQTTICITLIQLQAAANIRGRVMSYVAMGYFGMLPIGSLLIGGISQRVGAPAALLCQGIAALGITAAFTSYLRKPQETSLS